jgi:hypothetical protein
MQWIESGWDRGLSVIEGPVVSRSTKRFNQERVKHKDSGKQRTR